MYVYFMSVPDLTSECSFECSNVPLNAYMYFFRCFCYWSLRCWFRDIYRVIFGNIFSVFKGVGHFGIGCLLDFLFCKQVCHSIRCVVHLHCIYSDEDIIVFEGSVDHLFYFWPRLFIKACCYLWDSNQCQALSKHELLHGYK